jgi:hypothetical protein
MRNINTKALCFTILFIISIVSSSIHVQCRSLPNELISNGVDDDVQSSQQDSNYYLLLNRSNNNNNDKEIVEFESSNSGEYCKQMYGFLPCSNNIFGHLFLILVYEYLLFHGESYLAAGGEQIFKILGPGVFGASAFDILGALPESLILLGIASNSQNVYPIVLNFKFFLINFF